MSLRQLRLVLEVDDLDAALAFFRDVVGMPEQAAFEAEGGARVAILAAPSATLELANPAQIAFIDEVEVGRAVAHPFPGRLRIALEDSDVGAATERLVAGGAELVAAPVETPWRSRNARLEGPGGIQLTVFEELDTASG